MIKLIIYFFLNFFLFISIQADNVTVGTLKNRLKQIDDSYMCFIQKINTSEDDIKEINRGELWIKRPNLFHCHMFDPEESFLISDGITIWFYVPVIKQVTAYNFQKVIDNNILFKLLFDDDISQWNDYCVIQQNDLFYLNPIFLKNINSSRYKIKINDHGILNQFSIFESNTKQINCYLFNQRIESIDINKFRFVISEDIQFDDQR